MGRKSRRHGHKKSRKEHEENREETDLHLQEEGSLKRCQHLSKAVKLGVLQNQVPHMKLGQCSLCTGLDEDTGICMCLRCAKQGCDRYSDDKHALSHYDQCPSHNITIHLKSMIVWCYSCDMEIPVEPNSDLYECVKLLIKALKLDAPNDLKLPIPKAGASGPTAKLNHVINLPSNNRTQKIKGLVNLGNTCFFNAVMQNLNQTELLHIATTYVNQSDYPQRIKGPNDTVTVQVTNPAGSLLVSLNKLLTDFRSSASGPLNPKFLFSEICKKAPRFKGFQQQDSQELLRYLLDSVKTDQLKRVKIGVLKHFEVSEGVDIKSLPPEKKEKIKEYVHYVTAPCIDSVFAGKLDSIIVCHRCQKESRVTESFLDLSLSLVKQQEQKVKPKSNKTSPALSGKKQNCAVDQTEDSKQQPLSKHQQKVAKEAKRKKGRKKGKQRTISRSSEDGSIQVKQESFQNDDNIDVASDLENAQDSNKKDERNDHTHQQDNKNDSNSEDNAQNSDINNSELSSGFRNLSPASLEKKADILGSMSDPNTHNKKNGIPDEALDLSNLNCISAEESTQATLLKQEDEYTSTSKQNTEAERNSELINSSSEDANDDAIKVSKNLLDSVDSLQIYSNSTIELGSHHLSEIFPNDTPTNKAEDVSSLGKESKETTNFTCVDEKSIKDPNDHGTRIDDHGTRIDLMQAANQCPYSEDVHKEYECTAHVDKRSNEFEKCSEENGIVCNANMADTCNSVPKTKNQTIFEERFINVSDDLEVKNDDNSIIDCKKHSAVAIQRDACQSIILKEKVLYLNSEEKNDLNDQDRDFSSSEKCVDANVQEESTYSLLKQKVSFVDDENTSINLTRSFQSDLNLEVNTKTSTSMPDNDSKDLNSGCDKKSLLTPENYSRSQNCKKEQFQEELTTGTACRNVSQSNAIESDTGSKATDLSSIDNNFDRPKFNCEQSYELETKQGTQENEQDKRREELCKEKKSGKKCSSNQQNELAETNIDSNVLDSYNANRSQAGDIPSLEECDAILCNTVKTETTSPNSYGTTSTSPKVHTVGPPYTLSPGECSVQSCLVQFCSPEVLQGKNKFLCEVCSKGRDEQDEDDGDSSDESTKGAKAPKRVYTEATKQLLISSTPPVLTLHLKRFQQVGHGLKKVPKHVEFPFVLDIAPFCCTGTEIASDSSNTVLYSLIGLVEHSGGLNSGHYTACIKLKHKPSYHPTDLATIKDLSSFIQEIWSKDRRADYTHQRPGDGQWYYVSDSRATMVTEDKVLRSQAYMLFYERLPLKRTSQCILTCSSAHTY